MNLYAYTLADPISGAGCVGQDRATIRVVGHLRLAKSPHAGSQTGPSVKPPERGGKWLLQQLSPGPHRGISGHSPRRRSCRSRFRRRRDCPRVWPPGQWPCCRRPGTPRRHRTRRPSGAQRGGASSTHAPDRHSYLKRREGVETCNDSNVEGDGGGRNAPVPRSASECLIVWEPPRDIRMQSLGVAHISQTFRFHLAISAAASVAVTF